MTTMLDLPDDLLDEIFSRVPLDSTTAVRSTCKAWSESRMIVMMDQCLSNERSCQRKRINKASR